MNLTRGLRFILCNDQEEAKIVTDYCLEKGLEFNLVEQKNVSSMRDDDGPDPIIVWYVGGPIHQTELVKLTSGVALF